MSEIVSTTGGVIPLPKDRSIMFAKQVDQASIEEVAKRIIEINENDRVLEKLYPVYGLNFVAPPIKIYIDSYGGEVYQIFGLIGIIEQSITPVHTYCTGAAMSCGFILLIFGHKRFAFRYSTPLYHQVSNFSMGTLKQLDEEMVETKRLQKIIEEMTLRKTKITAKKLAKIYKRKIDWFMDAKEALKLGVVDEII